MLEYIVQLVIAMTLMKRICSNAFHEIIALSIVHSPPSDAEVFGIILKARKGRVRHMRYFEQLPWVHQGEV
jgi:hypothetical protein